MAKQALSRKVENPPVFIPDKLYFKIGEVAELIGVEPYVLRYWETEFKEIAPVKSRTNQRLYKRRDVETILKIRDLLYKERFTINGARKRLKEVERPAENQLGLILEGTDPSPSSEMKKSLANELSSLMGEMIESLRESA